MSNAYGDSWYLSEIDRSRKLLMIKNEKDRYRELLQQIYEVWSGWNRSSIRNFFLLLETLQWRKVSTYEVMVEHFKR
jgi:hypothetical protein